MEDKKKEVEVKEVKKDLKEEKVEEKKMRQIIIETDGNDIKLTQAEVSGKIELIAILQSVIGFINKQD